MRVHLPNSAFLGNIEAFIREFDPGDPSQLRLTANKKWISVHPAALVMISALGSKINPQRISCEPLEAKSKHYLERMGLFRSLKIDSGIDVVNHDSTGRFIPITEIKNSEGLTHFITEMIPMLHLEPRHAEPIQYVVSELVRNVVEHSSSSHGAFVAAQYYAKSNSIRFGIADTGVGIKKTITKSHRADTDLASIQLALTPGITGTTTKEGGTEFNAGAGLFFIKVIATVNRNFFVVYSGNALYKLLKQSSKKRHRIHANPFEDRHTAVSDLPYWQGTVIGIDMTLEATESFSEILEKMRTVYGDAIRARKKERYRRPKFV